MLAAEIQARPGGVGGNRRVEKCGERLGLDCRVPIDVGGIGFLPGVRFPGRRRQGRTRFHPAEERREGAGNGGGDLRHWIDEGHGGHSHRLARSGKCAEQRDDERLSAAYVFVQDVVAPGIDHVQRLLLRSDPTMDEAGAAGIDERIVGGLNDIHRTDDVEQAALELVGRLAQFDQAAHRHVAVFDLRMFRLGELERLDAVLGVDPFGQPVDAVNERRIGEIAVAEFERRGRHHAGEARRPRGRHLQRSEAPVANRPAPHWGEAT
jgi:hypothetical protein